MERTSNELVTDEVLWVKIGIVNNEVQGVEKHIMRKKVAGNEDINNE